MQIDWRMCELVVMVSLLTDLNLKPELINLGKHDVGSLNRHSALGRRSVHKH